MGSNYKKSLYSHQLFVYTYKVFSIFVFQSLSFYCVLMRILWRNAVLEKDRIIDKKLRKKTQRILVHNDS